MNSKPSTSTSMNSSSRGTKRKASDEDGNDSKRPKVASDNNRPIAGNREPPADLAAERVFNIMDAPSPETMTRVTKGAREKYRRAHAFITRFLRAYRKAFGPNPEAPCAKTYGDFCAWLKENPTRRVSYKDDRTMASAWSRNKNVLAKIFIEDLDAREAEQAATGPEPEAEAGGTEQLAEAEVEAEEAAREEAAGEEEEEKEEEEGEDEEEDEEEEEEEREQESSSPPGYMASVSAVVDDEAPATFSYDESHDDDGEREFLSVVTPRASSSIRLPSIQPTAADLACAQALLQLSKSRR
ncbi:hypothetical protein PVAG01_05912 [Phlyctema vagabunda]|uniref:Uncharacterized protein n=1 Tax=Phlyctema vagabunda TaxID=108571 RepID=A0ABR4PEK5_9HELO